MFAGWLMRTLEHHQGNYAWRYAVVWTLVFQVLTLVCCFRLCREWKRLGGKEHFAPPAVGRPIEETP